jgi:hypothetical protein
MAGAATPSDGIPAWRRKDASVSCSSAREVRFETKAMKLPVDG